MRSRESDLRASEARLVYVGTGTPAMAADFARTHAGPHPVLSDVQRRSYEGAGMRRAPGSTLHWRLFANAWRAFRRGFRQGRVQGDPWQQGGVLVFDAHAVLHHAQVDRVGGDPIDLDAVLAVVRAGGCASGGPPGRA